MKNKAYQVAEFDKEYGHLTHEIESVIDILHEGVCFTNTDGVVLRINPMYEKLSGLSPKVLLGKKVSYLNGKHGLFENPDSIDEYLKAEKGIYCGPVSPLVLKTKKPANAIQKTKGGNRNLLHGYPIFDKNNEIALVMTFIRDINSLTLFKERQMAYHKDIYAKFRATINVVDSEQSNPPNLILKSAAMKRIWAQLKNISPTDATVLILGETGVGKGEIARQIHGNSKRAGEIFFKADCAGIPDNLIESEFFGYAKGAFSGANSVGKPGYFTASDKGTIFLDEIGELPILMQSKLLRVLQDKEVIQLGSVVPKKLDVRIIAATNVDLEQAVKDKTFRQDLFYRLNVSVLNIPPLRERQEDILPLTKHFLNIYNVKYKKKVTLDKEVIPLLLGHSWPGNIRELKNMIQGLVINSESNLISPENLPMALQSKKTTPISTIHFADEEMPEQSLKQIIKKIERKILLNAYEQHGCIHEVARRFKIDRTTVARKLK